MYNFLKDFQVKDFRSPQFRTELYFKVKNILIKIFEAEKTYYNDNEIHQKIEYLSQFILDIYKMGLDVGGNNKKLEDYEEKK